MNQSLVEIEISGVALSTSSPSTSSLVTDIKENHETSEATNASSPPFESSECTATEVPKISRRPSLVQSTISEIEDLPVQLTAEIGRSLVQRYGPPSTTSLTERIARLTSTEKKDFAKIKKEWMARGLLINDALLWRIAIEANFESKEGKRLVKAYAHHLTRAHTIGDSSFILSSPAVVWLPRISTKKADHVIYIYPAKLKSGEATLVQLFTSTIEAILERSAYAKIGILVNWNEYRFSLEQMSACSLDTFMQWVQLWQAPVPLADVLMVNCGLDVLKVWRNSLKPLVVKDFAPRLSYVAEDANHLIKYLNQGCAPDLPSELPSGQASPEHLATDFATYHKALQELKKTMSAETAEGTIAEVEIAELSSETSSHHKSIHKTVEKDNEASGSGSESVGRSDLSKTTRKKSSKKKQPKNTDEMDLSLTSPSRHLAKKRLKQVQDENSKPVKSTESMLGSIEGDNDDDEEDEFFGDADDDVPGITTSLRTQASHTDKPKNDLNEQPDKMGVKKKKSKCDECGDESCISMHDGKKKSIKVKKCSNNDLSVSSHNGSKKTKATNSEALGGRELSSQEHNSEKPQTKYDLSESAQRKSKSLKNKKGEDSSDQSVPAQNSKSKKDAKVKKKSSRRASLKSTTNLVDVGDAKECKESQGNMPKGNKRDQLVEVLIGTERKLMDGNDSEE